MSLRPCHRRFLVGLSVLLAAGASLGVAWQIAFRLVPLPASLFEPMAPGSSFVDRYGHSLRSTVAPAGEFSVPVTFAQLPPVLVAATIAAEDKRFWHHQGIDWLATGRAFHSLVRHRRVVSGASTITQQLIKLSQPHQRTALAKIREALQARRLEECWNKPQILAAYLNRLHYGNLTRGCVAAAELYFAKPLHDLSPAEAALLAGLAQAPSRLNPYRHFEPACQRQRWVLGRMLALDLILPEQWARAIETPLRLQPLRRHFRAPHFVDLVLESELRTGSDVRHETTLDLDLNDFVTRTLRETIARLRDRHAQQAAAVVLDNASGEVLALVGSPDYFASDAGQVNGTMARRSPGSALKPFTYLLAFEAGTTPASIIPDLPVEFVTARGVFAPVNYNRRCFGPTRARVALANSLNIPAVKLLDAIGGASVLQKRLQQLGLSTLELPPDHYGLGLTLGNAEVRLLELVNAYACLARLGVSQPYRLLRPSRPLDNPLVDAVGTRRGQHSAPSLPIDKLHRKGRDLTLRGPLTGIPWPKNFSAHSLSAHTTQFPRQLCESNACYLIADILADNQARALAFGLDSDLRFAFPVACKTGTSTDFRDNWAIGYTPEFTVGVWVGNFDGTPMERVSGLTGAAPALHKIFVHLHETRGTSWYEQPPEVVNRWVHSLTGKGLSGPHPQGVQEKFREGSLPPVEQPDDYDSSGRVRLTIDYEAWYHSSDNWLYHAAAVAETSVQLRILSPVAGSVYFLDPDLPDDGRRLLLQAEGSAVVGWECETLLFEQRAGKQFVLLQPGRHTVVARRPDGSQQQTSFEVRKL